MQLLRADERAFLPLCFSVCVVDEVYETAGRIIRSTGYFSEPLKLVTS